MGTTQLRSLVEYRIRLNVNDYRFPDPVVIVTVEINVYPNFKSVLKPVVVLLVVCTLCY